ncbi:MAG TPA: hypothetical protein VNI57_01840 [Candidatus Saccharimonadales bacterium]|nr:hypothetical protein [Candidatus Saccharimonadales bacterium]
MRSRFTAGITVTLALSLAATPCTSAQDLVIRTIAGGGPDNVGATAVSVLATSVLVAPSGDVYVASWNTSNWGQIHLVDPNGHMTLVAGHRYGGSARDGSPATDIGVSEAHGMVLDPSGNLFFSDPAYRLVWRVDATTGIATIVAGGGPSGTSQDGIPARDAELRFPYGLAIDGSGNLLIAESTRSRIRRVDAVTGIITTVAGTGTAGFSGDGGPATSAMLDSPYDVAVDASGSLYISDSDNHRVRMVDGATGIITTVAGTGTAGFDGDGGPATNATLFAPVGLVLTAAGNLFIADYGTDLDGPFGGRVRVVDAATGIISLYAGAGASSGENIPATDLQMNAPEGLDLDAAGNLFMADAGDPLFVGPELTGRLYRVDQATGLVSTYAGGALGIGDGGPAADAILGGTKGLAIDGSGNLFESESGPWVVRRIDAVTGVITTVAGSPDAGLGTGDGGPAVMAGLYQPQGLALDASGDLFIADVHDQRVRRVDMTTGIIDTYVGNGTQGFSGDGGAATSASLNYPSDVAFDSSGNLYIADRLNSRIRKVDSHNKHISTAAGNGTPGFSGDGGAAIDASLRSPQAIAFDAADNLFIADSENYRVRRVDGATGIISTVAGDGTVGYGGDGGSATSAQIGLIASIEVDPDGNLLLVDGSAHRVRKVDMTTGIIDTVVGTGGSGSGLDGVEARLAELRGPMGIVSDGASGFFLGDGRRIRQVTPATTPPEAGCVPGGEDPNGPSGVTAAPAPYGMLALSWSPSCIATDTDFDVYEGDMTDFTSYVPVTCGAGNSTNITFAPIPRSAYYLVVPRSYSREGSYGLDGDGFERPASTAACMAQAIAACP